ncbi:transmembrane protein 14A isoform X1 [Pituophis catenifer annectens]|uniref:transmembrane protein 14A isoform X1 n=1 Tax=Pituophis catenifer annectens TaxID=94852 RepID=UPI003990F04D
MGFVVLSCLATSSVPGSQGGGSQLHACSQQDRGTVARPEFLRGKLFTMSVDWIGFGYGLVVALGGIVGYIRKGSKISLVAGLLFGLLACYGAYWVTHDPKDVKISLLTAFTLTTIMGVRFKRTKKLIPAGIIAGLSLVMVVRLVFRLI